MAEYDFDAAVAKTKEDELKGALYTGVTNNPDEQARLQDLSRRTGLPVDAVQQNRQQVEQDERLNSFDFPKVVKDSPKLASWLADPNNAAVAHDDVGSLSTMESILIKPFDYLRSIGKGFISQGAGSTLFGAGAQGDIFSRNADKIGQAVGSTFTDAANMLSLSHTPKTRGALDFSNTGYLNNTNSLMTNVQPRTDALANMSDSAALKSAGQSLKTAGDTIGVPKSRQGFDTQVAEGVGQLGFQIAASLLTGNLANVAMMSAQGADQMAEQVKNDKGSQAQIDQAVLMGSVITPLTEKFGLDAILNRVPPAIKNRTLRFIADKFAAGGIEAAQEVTEGILQNVAQRATTDPNADLTKGLAEQASVAGVTGAIVRAALGVKRFNVEREHEDFFKALQQGTNESKLFQRLPDRFQELVKQYTENGPIQNVFVDANKVAEYYQSQHLDPAQAMSNAGATNYHDALLSGGDVVIPMDGFIAKLAPTEALQGLLPDFRLAQGDQSIGEMQLDEANADSHAAAISQNIAQINQAAQTDTQLSTAVNEIIDNVSGQLQARYDTNTANKLASVMRGIAVLAHNANPEVNPVTAARQLWAKYGLTVNANPLPSVLTNKPDFDVQIDSLIDRVRSGDIPNPAQINGTSLGDFLRDKGGLQNEGGELTARDVQATNKSFSKNLFNPQGLSFDTARELAAEAGYIQTDGTVADFINSIDNELRGEPVYSQYNFSNAHYQQAQALNELGDWLDKLGINLNATDNQAVKKMMKEAMGGDGATFNQMDELLQSFNEADTIRIQPSESAQDEAQFLSSFPTGTRYPSDTKLLKRIRSASDQAYRELDGNPETTREINRALGPFSAYRINAEILGPDSFNPDGSLNVQVYGKEQLAAGLTDEPALLFTVKPDGELTVNGPTPSSDTFKQFKKLGWAVKAQANGVEQDGWSALTNHDGKNIPISEILPLLADVHARVRDWRMADKVGLHWGRATGALGGSFIDNPTAIFFQSTDDDKRGSIEIGLDRKIIINLFEQQNLSTFLHEAGHLYLEVLGDLAEAEGTSQRVKDDYAKALQFLGVKSRNEIGVEQHELFARANEAYLMEGKAPSNELRGVFQRFKAWMQFIYKTAKALNVTLNDDIRGVFDRIYATDAEIEDAKRQDSFKELFIDAASANMTDAEYSAYQEIAVNQTENAKDKLRQDTMRVERLKRERWWKEQRSKVAEEVADEYDATPAAHAFEQLTLMDGDIKLSKPSLIAKYGDNITKRLRRGYGDNRGAVYNDEGMDADLAAELLGYASGDALINDLVNLPVRARFIAAESDARMLQRHGDLLNDIAIADAAQEALHNGQREQVLRIELRTLNKLVNPARKLVNAANRNDLQQARTASELPPINAFRDAAKGMIGQQAVKDINPNSYLLTERKSSRAAFEAMGKKDYALASSMKQRELLNHYLYLEASKAKQEAAKIYDYAKGLQKTTAQERIGLAGNGYLESLNAILESYDFKQRSNQQLNALLLARTAAENAEQDGEIIEIDEELLGLPINYRELPMDQLRAVQDMLKNIEHVAREANKFRTAEQVQALSALAEKSLLEIRHGLPQQASERRSKRNPNEDRKRSVAGYFNEMRGLGSFIREAVGFQENSTLWNYTVRVLNEAASKESVMLHEAAGKLDALFKQYDRTYLYGKGKVIDGVGALNKMEQLMIAASYGTETGRQRMRDIGLDGKGFSQDEIERILDSLEEHDWQFVQGLWQTFDNYWPEVAAKQKRATGVEPLKVEPAPFMTRFGTMPGGYSPIAYESRADNSAAANDTVQLAKELRASAFTRSTTRRGFTKSREEQVKDKGGVRYDFGLIYKHLNEVIHDLTHHEALRDVNKLLTFKVDGVSVLDEINSRMGDGVRDEIKHVLEEVAVGSLRNLSTQERLIEKAAKGVAVAQMGYNFWNSLQNLTGYANSVAVLNPKWAAIGAAKAATEYDKPFVDNQFMQTRYLNLNRDINAMRGKLQERKGIKAVDATYEAYQAGSMYMLVRVQQIVDVPTWLGAYYKAKAEFPDSSEANHKEIANQAVLDAQGGGRTVDLSQFMRGTGAQRIFSVFAGYFNVTYQRTVESMKRAKANDFSPSAIGRMSVELLFLAIAPSVATTLMKEAINLGVGGDSDDDLFWTALKEQASFILGMFPYARELSSGLMGYGNYSGPLGVRIFKDLNDTITQAKQGEVDEKLSKASLKFIGDWLPIPTAQIIKTYDGFNAEDATPLALAFGKPKP